MRLRFIGPVACQLGLIGGIESITSTLDAFDLCHSRMGPNEEAADCSAAIFPGYFFVFQ